MRAEFEMQDKCGFRGGDTTLYRYCRNNPTNTTDPSGLAPPAKEDQKRPPSARLLSPHVTPAAILGTGEVFFDPVRMTLNTGTVEFKGRVRNDVVSIVFQYSEEGKIREVHHTVLTNTRTSDRTFRIPIKSGKKDGSEVELAGMPGIKLTPSASVLSGLVVEATFEHNGGKPTDPDVSVFWSQRVKTSFSSSRGGRKPFVKTEDWEYDGGFKYPVQDDNRTHRLFDFPSYNLPMPCKMKVEADAKGGMVLVIELEQSTNSFLKEHNASQKILEFAYEYSWEFQTYLVDSASKKPLGYLKWDFKVYDDKDGIKVVPNTKPEWKPKTDTSVWRAIGEKE